MALTNYFELAKERLRELADMRGAHRTSDDVLDLCSECLDLCKSLGYESIDFAGGMDGVVSFMACHTLFDIEVVFTARGMADCYIEADDEDIWSQTSPFGEVKTFLIRSTPIACALPGFSHIPSSTVTKDASVARLFRTPPTGEYLWLRSTARPENREVFARTSAVSIPA